MFNLSKIKEFVIEIGGIAYFVQSFFKESFTKPFELRELLRQCYNVGNRSFLLIGITGFIIGLVLTLQTRPTLEDFGAESWMPAMVGISIIREIGPVIIALIFTGRVASGIGAELGSMSVSEQIDAMEVSGTNPFKYLVVTRIIACTLMLPLLVIFGDAIALLGSFLVENTKENVSLTLYFTQIFKSLGFNDVIPAVLKTFFFGFSVGVVGCFKGYYCEKGTVGVGNAANSAVVSSSIMIFIIDFIAVFINDIFFEL